MKTEVIPQVHGDECEDGWKDLGAAAIHSPPDHPAHPHRVTPQVMNLISPQPL